jgi:hypothetical protein
MPRHALRSELAAKLTDGWTGAAGRHVLGADMPGGTGLRHALSSEVAALVVGPAETIPTFHGYASNRAFAVTNTVGPVTGARAGDVLLAFGSGNDQTTTLTPPAGAGWTQIGSTGGATAGWLRVFATTATAADQAGGTWTWPSSHNHLLTIGAWGAAKLPTVAGMVRATAGALTVTAPDQTTAAANALLVCFAFYVTNGTAPAWPAAMTVRIPNTTTTCDGVAAEERRPTPGATGTRTFTAGTTAPAALTAASLVLEPA